MTPRTAHCIVAFRWSSPREWLNQHIQRVLIFERGPEWLLLQAMTQTGLTDALTDEEIAEMFAEEMDLAGYYRPLDEDDPR